MAQLFHDFLVISMTDEPDSARVEWRMGKETLNEKEICQFAVPYPRLLKKTTANSCAPATDFVFVLTKPGIGGVIIRTYGFTRRYLGRGMRDRNDLGCVPLNSCRFTLMATSLSPSM